MTKSWILRTLQLAAVAGVTLAVCAIPYTAAYRDARFRHLGLEELSRTQEAHVNDPIFLYYFGRRLNERQQYGASLPVLERAVGLDPDAARARDEWARALLATGNVTGAFAELRQFVGTHPNLADAHFLIGKFYATQENLTTARSALERTVQLDPQNGEAWSLLGKVRIKMADYAGARQALETALRLRPGAADDHLQLGVLLAPDDPHHARQEFARAAALAPRNPVVRREFSRFLLTTQDAREAEAQARQAVQLDAQDEFAALMLARALVAQNRWNEALPYLEQAARLAPNDPVPYQDLARAYRHANDVKRAEACERRYVQLFAEARERQRLKDATFVHPKDPQVRQRYAAALAETGDVNECVRQEALALQKPPDHPRVLLAAARDLNTAHFSKQALPLARQALQEAPQNPEAFETCADILLNLGRLHEAEVNFERIRDWRTGRRALYQQKLAQAAARLAADNAPAERLLRQAAREPDPGRAEQSLQQALALDPENTRCLHALLRLQFAREENEAALETAHRLAALSPEDGLAPALMVILLLERQGTQPRPEAAYRTLDSYLHAAEIDSSATPTRLYARGLLDLKRGRAPAAVRDLEQAARLSPDSIAIYRQLAAARMLVGDSKGAQQALAAAQARE